MHMPMMDFIMLNVFLARNLLKCVSLTESTYNNLVTLFLYFIKLVSSRLPCINKTERRR